MSCGAAFTLARVRAPASEASGASRPALTSGAAVVTWNALAEALLSVVETALASSVAGAP